MQKMVAAAFAIMISSGPAWASHCFASHGFFVFGQDAQEHLTAPTARVCNIGLHFHGGGASDLSVTQPPSHGTVTPISSTVLQYSSQPGYKGKDTFTYQVSGELMGRRVQSGTSRIAVDVDVVP